MKRNTIVQQYINNKHFYEGFTKTVASLLEVLLRDAQINYQKVEYRTKSFHSLENKIKRKSLSGKNYKELDDIVDLSGVRVIVFFKDDVEKVIELITTEFKIHEVENVDKGLNFVNNPKEFGYQSKHRVISINNQRSNLKEYKRFNSVKCEIQIRTVLQHAWAEIEHDIGYKSDLSEKDQERIELTRMFSQNAALLEVADDNFLKIRKGYQKLLSNYRSSIAREDYNLPLNLDSVREYIDRNSNKNEISISNLQIRNTRASSELRKAREGKISNLSEFDLGEKSKKKA